MDGSHRRLGEKSVWERRSLGIPFGVSSVCVPPALSISKQSEICLYSVGQGRQAKSISHWLRRSPPSRISFRVTPHYDILQEVGNELSGSPANIGSVVAIQGRVVRLLVSTGRKPMLWKRS